MKDNDELILSEDGNFEWQKLKSKTNATKHGFGFEEILEVFDDPFLLTMRDNKHSNEEEREISLGCLNGVVVILVIYTQRERIHIISARKAETKWRKIYYDYVKKINA